MLGKFSIGIRDAGVLMVSKYYIDNIKMFGKYCGDLKLTPFFG